jgi:hypothetical protein
MRTRRVSWSAQQVGVSVRGESALTQFAEQEQERVRRQITGVQLVHASDHNRLAVHSLPKQRLTLTLRQRVLD